MNAANGPPRAAWQEQLLFDRSPSISVAIARALLAPAAAAFGAAVRARSALYDRGLLHAARLPVPVISVGNLTVGGTGKTPFVAWLAARLVAEGRRPAILTRGFGARRGAAPRRVDVSGSENDRESDEALLLAARVPGAPVIAGRDRGLGARVALEAGADVILLDDGFQHRALARDLDLVLLDPRVSPGRGSLLPAGPLREPWRAADRAHVLAVVDGPGVEAPDGRPVVRAERRARALRSAGGRTEPPAALRGRSVLLLSGIGRPELFRSLAEREGAAVVGEARFADHHAFRPDELARVSVDASRLGASGIVTTEKDAARLPRAFLDREDVLVLEIALAVVEGADLLDRAVREALRARPQ